MSTERGFTLIDLIIAIVILSVGVSGLLVVFSTSVANSADPMVHKNMLSIAEQMMDEIVLKPYATSPNAAPAVCARNTYNDVSDYNGYQSTGICDIDGNAIATLSSYAISVSVTPDASTFVAAGVPASQPPWKIVVTVTHAGQSFSLTGWRSNYAS